MKIFATSLLFALCFSSCVIRSNVGIPAQQEFVLGANRHQAFKVKAQNTGSVSVEVSDRFGNGSSTLSQVLEPGEEAEIRFTQNSAAILKNDNPSEAMIKVKITGDTGLNMGYEAN